MPRKEEKFYERRFVVEGRGPIPYDMLRYDCAFPASSADAAAMERAARGEIARVRLISRSRGGEITHDRWLSFGWTALQED